MQPQGGQPTTPATMPIQEGAGIQNQFSHALMQAQNGNWAPQQNYWSGLINTM